MISFAGDPFERLEYTGAALQSQLQLAQSEGNNAEILEINRLIAIAGGAFDFTDANLNNTVAITPSRFEEWLSNVWTGFL